MTNGVGHEAGETARSVVSNLSSQPVLLFLLVFILIVLFIFAWATEQIRGHQEEAMKALLANQTQLLQNCGPKQ